MTRGKGVGEGVSVWASKQTRKQTNKQRGKLRFPSRTARDPPQRISCRRRPPTPPPAAAVRPRPPERTPGSLRRFRRGPPYPGCRLTELTNVNTFQQILTSFGKCQQMDKIPSVPNVSGGACPPPRYSPASRKATVSQGVRQTLRIEVDLSPAPHTVEVQRYFFTSHVTGSRTYCSTFRCSPFVFC